MESLFIHMITTMTEYKSEKKTPMTGFVVQGHKYAEAIRILRVGVNYVGFSHASLLSHWFAFDVHSIVTSTVRSLLPVEDVMKPVQSQRCSSQNACCLFPYFLFLKVLRSSCSCR